MSYHIGLNRVRILCNYPAVGFLGLQLPNSKWKREHDDSLVDTLKNTEILILDSWTHLVNWNFERDTHLTEDMGLQNQQRWSNINTQSSLAPVAVRSSNGKSVKMAMVDRIRLKTMNDHEEEEVFAH